MSDPTAAPACRAALMEATERWPDRNKASDGILSSPQHRLQSPGSDHDDGNAWDLTDDPAAGCDAHAEVRAIVDRRDPRVKYAISNRRIWSAARAAEGWRPYNGSNPHTVHAHVSIYSSRRGDTSPWFAQVEAQGAVQPQPTTAPEDDDMTPEQADTLAALKFSTDYLRRDVREIANVLNKLLAAADRPERLDIPSAHSVDYKIES